MISLDQDHPLHTVSPSVRYHIATRAEETDRAVEYFSSFGSMLGNVKCMIINVGGLNKMDGGWRAGA